VTDGFVRSGRDTEKCQCLDVLSRTTAAAEYVVTVGYVLNIDVSVT